MPPFSGTREEYYGELYFRLMKDKGDDIPFAISVATESWQPKRVLDLGGGFGRVARQLAQIGYEVTVVDKSQDLLDIGKRWSNKEGSGTAQNISWEHANIAEPLNDLPINWFPLALCMHNTVNEILHDLQGLFDNLARHLEAGGYAIVSAVDEKPYTRTGLTEWVGSFATPDESDWIVTSLTIPRSGDALYRLLLFYDQYQEGILNRRVVRTLDWRIWSVQELSQAALRAGMQLTQSMDEGSPRPLVFQKA